MGRITIPRADISKARFSWPGFLVKAPGLLFRLLTNTRRRSERLMGGLEQKVRHYAAMAVEGAGPEELITSLHTEISDLRKTLVEARFGAVFIPLGLSAPLILQKCCARWFDNADDTLANRLLIGAGNMDSAEAGIDLWQLAAVAHDDPAVAQIIDSGDCWQTVRQKPDISIDV